MTDNEIKTYLSFLAKYCKYEYNDIRVDEVLLGAFDLINRQQAEIERLDKRNIKNCRNWQSKFYMLRDKAIKEFAERLKKSDDFYDRVRAIVNVDNIDCLINVIDNLAEEMVGEESA